MSVFSRHFGRAYAPPAIAALALATALLVDGCGAGYRPVITPINPSGPAAQPTSLVAVVSSPAPGSPGVATIVDYSGDTIVAQAPIGVGPINFTLDETGTTGYTYNSDGTVSNFPVNSNLQQKQITVTTLPSTAQPVNLFSPSSGLWITDLNANPADAVHPFGVDVLTGSPANFKLSVPVAPNPVALVGPALVGERNYVITQGAVTSGVDCNNAPGAAPTGEADAIEVANNTISARIPLGQCPVYALESPDSRRLFVLNRGSDTITVINSQTNTLDQCTPFTNQNGQLVTCHPSLPLSTAAGLTGPGVPAKAGPVYAEYNLATSQLIVADYDGGTINVIDVSLDEFGNDSGTFGTTFTIPVGANPASVTALYDGSRAYTANQADGTVTVVNLVSHTVEKKAVAVTGHPRTVASTQNSQFGKVYVVSPDSPYLTIIRTDQDIVDATVLVQGNILDARVTTVNGTTGNPNVQSRKPGYGQPCYLPGAAAAASYASCTTLPTGAP